MVQTYFFPDIRKVGGAVSTAIVRAGAKGILHPLSCGPTVA